MSEFKTGVLDGKPLLNNRPHKKLPRLFCEELGITCYSEENEKLRLDLEQTNERIKEFICIERNLNIELLKANKDIQVLADYLAVLANRYYLVMSDDDLKTASELTNKYKEK